MLTESCCFGCSGAGGCSPHSAHSSSGFSNSTIFLYKGVNDQLLAKKAPNSKDGSVKTKVEKSMSTIGSREITKPDPYKGR